MNRLLTLAGKRLLSSCYPKVVVVVVAAVFFSNMASGIAADSAPQNRSTELSTRADSFFTEGRKVGASFGEAECLRNALARHKEGMSIAFSSSLQNTLWLSGCLQTSHIQDSFCTNVPSPSDIVKETAWAASACKGRGVSDNYCVLLFMAVASYCPSPQRALKLKPAG